jgi:hypothetical protein
MLRIGPNNATRLTQNRLALVGERPTLAGTDCGLGPMKGEGGAKGPV